MRSIFLATLTLLGGPIRAPAGEGEKIPEGTVELPSAGLRAVIADNEAHGAVHRAGYSGLAELEPRGLGRSLFVPAYAGLNFEHILSGDAASYGWDIFEPRRAPMALHRISASSVELRQERTENWPLRTRLTYALAGEDAIDITVTATPLGDAWRKHGWLGLFFASYIDAPEDGAIHFIGRSRPGKGDPAARWIRHLSPRHGEAACHRPAGSAWDPPMDPGLRIPLATGHSDLEYVYPFYYGVTRGKALIFLFEKPTEKAEARFAQSPTGGGEKNPAWDFIFIGRGAEAGKETRFRMRLICREFRGREDVIRAYETWSGEHVERPRDDPVGRLLEHVHADMLCEPAAVPDEENAYLVWARLPEDSGPEDEAGDNEGEEDAVYAAEDEGPFPSGSLGERLSAAIERRESLFRTWDEGIARGRFQWPRGPGRLEGEEKDRAFSLILRSARVHRWRVLRAKLTAAQGDYDLVEKDILALLHTAAILASAEENLIVHLMGTGHASRAHGLVRWLARQNDAPVDLLERLLQRIDGLPDRKSGARAVRAEFCTFFLPSLARIPDGADPVRLAEAHAEDIEAGAYRDSVVRYTAAVLEGHPKPFDREATVRLESDLMARLVSSLDAPWRERPRNVAAEVIRETEGWPEELVKPQTPFSGSAEPIVLADDAVRKAREALRPIENPFGKLSIRGIHTGGFLRTFEDVVVEDPRTTEAHRAATRAVVALRIHARRNGGALPAALSDVVTAKILPSVPQDPFTDEPMRYSRERAIVWSVGPDGKDDGGREPNTEDSEAPSDLVWKLAAQ